jgi:hypothetical protein
MAGRIRSHIRYALSVLRGPCDITAALDALELAEAELGAAQAARDERRHVAERRLGSLRIGETVRQRMRKAV